MVTCRRPAPWCSPSCIHRGHQLWRPHDIETNNLGCQPPCYMLFVCWSTQATPGTITVKCGGDFQPGQRASRFHLHPESAAGMASQSRPRLGNIRTSTTGAVTSVEPTASNLPNAVHWGSSRSAVLRVSRQLSCIGVGCEAQSLASPDVESLR